MSILVSGTEVRAGVLLESGPGAATFNMALDEAMLHSMPRLGRPVLRFYGWTEPASSFGYFQKYAEIEKLTVLRPLVRRPTGGGLVPHDSDWTYSVAFPASDPWYALTATESYRRVHLWLQAAFAKLEITTELALTCRKPIHGQCFVGNEKFDLLWQGQKIAGAAQRRTREGLLVQGSVQPPPLGLVRGDWQRAALKVSAFDPPLQWTPFDPDQALMKLALELVERKYGQAAYNQKR